MKNFTFIKNVKGGLTITLHSYDMMLPKRNFTIAHNVDRVSIPEQYALGFFVSEEAIRQYEQGLFTIENYDELEKMSQTVGLFTNIESSVVYSKEDIATYLKEHNAEKIDEIISRGTYVEMTNLMMIAREQLESLPKNIIEKIEHACGVELEIE